MLAKVAAGAGLALLLPVLFIAAAVGAVAGGGTPAAFEVPCVPESHAGSDRASAPEQPAPGGEPGPSPLCQAGELEAMVLSHPRIQFRPEARADVASGRVDPRVLQVLLFLAERHSLGPVGPFITGHSYYVAGTTTASNHAFGRAVDIVVIDGLPVSLANPGARDAMEMILMLPPPLLPDELGGPWLLYHPDVGVFTKDHGDHLHVGWDREAP